MVNVNYNRVNSNDVNNDVVDKITVNSSKLTETICNNSYSNNVPHINNSDTKSQNNPFHHVKGVVPLTIYHKKSHFLEDGSFFSLVVFTIVEFS